MLKRILYLVLFLLSVSASYAQDSNRPVPVIFDTDMGPDYDDVGALAVLHALADKGEADILATIASTKYEGVAAVLNVLNTYFNKPDIPVGVPKGDALKLRDFQHWTDTLIAKYPHKIKINHEAPGAVDLYRKILARQPDKSVTIVTVGFLTNIANLLRSTPDEYSPLSGKELVNAKVKRLVSMAGKFPSGLEFNIEEDARSAKYAFEHWERPVLFSGFEIGKKIKTGLPLIHNDNIQNSPVKDVYRISIPQAEQDSAGRMSWDQTAVLAAVRGPEPYYSLKSGSIVVNEEGYNSWDEEGTNQYYLMEDKHFPEVQRIINDLMMHQPGVNQAEAQQNDKPLIVFVAGDHEYSSELTMPVLAEELEKSYGMCTKVLKSYPDHKAEENIPGLEALGDADLAVFFLRWRRLPASQIKHIQNYLESQKPLIGFRTSTHAFNYPEGHNLEEWNAFGKMAFNSPPGWNKEGHTHYGHESTTVVSVIPEAVKHPVLTGVDEQFDAASWLYTVLPGYPSGDSTPLLMGKPVNPNDPAAISHPVAWSGTNSFGAKFFMTTLGHPEDFWEVAFQQITINAVHWLLGEPVPQELTRIIKVDIKYGMHGSE